MEGGFYDALGNKLDPSKNTCAAPKDIPFHTKIQVKDTGTDKDGQIYEVTDRGGAITVKDGVYHFDLLFSSNSECNNWGKRKGKAIIGGTDSSDGLDFTTVSTDIIENVPFTIKDTSLFTTQALTTNNGLWIGDSRLVALRDSNIITDTSITIVAEGGKAAQYFINQYSSKIESVKSKNPAYIAILLGVNDPSTNIEPQKKLINKMRETFPDIPILMFKVVPVGHKYSYAGITCDVHNKNIEKFDSEISSFCSTVNNCSFVTTSTNGLLDTDGTLNSKYSYDGCHFNSEGMKIWYNNIISGITGSSGSGNSGGSGGSGSGGASGPLTHLVPLPPFVATDAQKKYGWSTEGGIDFVVLTNPDKFEYVSDRYTTEGGSGEDSGTSNSGDTENNGTTGDNNNEDTENNDNNIPDLPTQDFSINEDDKIFTILEGPDSNGTDTDNDGTGTDNNTGSGTNSGTSDNNGSGNNNSGSNTDSTGSGDNNKIDPDFNPALHYAYRGKYFARIRNTNNTFGAIKQNIEIKGISDIEAALKEAENNDTSSDTSNDANNDDRLNNLGEALSFKAFEKIDYPFDDGGGDIDTGNPNEDEGDNPNNNVGDNLQNNNNDNDNGNNNDDNRFSVIHKNDNDYVIKVSAWLKQVTSEDLNGGVDIDNLDEVMDHGITYWLSNENGKVVAASTVDLPKNTKAFGQRTVMFYGIEPGNYTFMIGGNHKFDIYVDDIVIEQIYDFNTKPGDFTSTGNINVHGIGNTSFDNGGIMIYSQAAPEGGAGDVPEIKTIITQEEYDEIMKNSSLLLINQYTNSFEPYDKGLPEILDAPIIEDDRLNTLTESINTFTDNMIRFNVIEAGPGSTDHCVKPADELNVLYKPIAVNAEPVYPDTIIPPNYATGDYDTNSEKSLPLEAVQNGTLEDKEILNKLFSYDYETLKDKVKESKGKPINYNDPYPYDDKITELEQHFPKVKIDEIESRLYSCNHPGCPVAHPMAKNFGMLNDMQIAQAKRIEQRLVRIENILSMMVRNIGRLGSRMNINCVYYGGQDIFGKYKTIRCLHDDRVQDTSVTLEQCLCCTRYEPILGQFYDILDETGFNGSAILDDMQMSYMTLDDFKNLNKVERRNSKFDYANVNKEIKEEDIPKSLIEEWDEADKKAYQEKITKDITNEEEKNKKIEAIQKSDYSFIMDWSETEVDSQAPDVKEYPNEGLKTKYYVNREEEEITKEDDDKDSILDKRIDKDVLDDRENLQKITRGEWVDTREEPDTTQSNKYTSEDFYFGNFNLNRTGYEYDNGLKGYIGLDFKAHSTNGSSGGTISNGLGGNSTEVRNKIVEMAKQIVADYDAGKACYSSATRTVDYTDPKYDGDKVAYDCTSFVSCCYKNAGLTSMYAKSCSGGTLIEEIVNNGGKMWLMNTEGIANALPGDVIVKATRQVSEADMGKYIDVSHAMVYIGDGQASHASSHKYGIKTEVISSGRRFDAGTHFFVRPKDLMDADANSNLNTNESNSTGNNDGTTESKGISSSTVDGYRYIKSFNNCKLNGYGMWQDSANNLTANNINNGKTSSGMYLANAIDSSIAAHNMPYGTKVYIPDLKGIVNSTGIFTVEDKACYCSDFDIFTSTRVKSEQIMNATANGSTVYILEWGEGNLAWSFSAAGDYATKNFKDTFTASWKDYKANYAATLGFTIFNTEDLYIKNKSWY